MEELEGRCLHQQCANREQNADRAGGKAADDAAQREDEHTRNDACGQDAADNAQIGLCSGLAGKRHGKPDDDRLGDDQGDIYLEQPLDRLQQGSQRRLATIPGIHARLHY